MVKVGDQVRIQSGLHEGRSGRVLLVRDTDDVLFEHGKQPLTGLLTEPMALVEYSDPHAEGGMSQVGVPVRRLVTR